MKNFIHLFFFTILMNINTIAQHPNIFISNENLPEEPTIVINPENTNELVAGANIINYYYSTDGGESWEWDTLTSSYGVWGDPCVIVDTAGHFYFFHLSNPQSDGNWIDRIVCQKSTDAGQTWSDGTYIGLNGTKAQDKEWATVDRQNNNIYVTWTQFDEYGSLDPMDSTLILFSRSTDGGQTWIDPVRLSKVGGDCIDSDNTVEGAVPAVGPNGEIYVSWAGPLGIVFDSSTDEGNTWLDDDIFVSALPGGWDFDIPGIMRCNGFPVTVCDTGNSPYRGTIYINWSDQRNGADDTDIWLIKSVDNGVSWGEPVRVNDDESGKHQFFTWMTIDPTNGYLYFVFYDRRNYDDDRTDVYMAVSKDGGETFINFRISETPFLPYASVFFGDYTNITAHNNVVRPIWTRLDGLDLSIWTALIDVNSIGIDNAEPSIFALEQNFQNPCNEATYFSHSLRSPCKISLKVYDLFGREVATIVNNKFVNAGIYSLSFDAKANNLPAGVYYFCLITSEKTVMKKMVLVE